MRVMDIDGLNFSKMGGLLPAVVVDHRSGAVLMLGFMNREAVAATLERGRVVFWSRTKGRLWEKGESSGNVLEVVTVADDCDGDTLLIEANPRGPTCHTGARSCFGGGDAVGVQFLRVLEDLIGERKREMPAGSYTAELFRRGLEGILAKVEEESGEVVEAARGETRERVAEESADLLYHLLVLLAERDVSLREVAEVLARRNG